MAPRFLAVLCILAAAACGDPDFERGRALERAAKWRDARGAYVVAIRRYGYNVGAARRIAAIECYRLRDAAACGLWTERLRGIEGPTRALEALAAQGDLLRAQAALAAGDLDAAVRFVRSALRRAPDHGGAHFVAGVVAERRGEPTAAVTSYARARRLRPRWRAPRDAIEALVRRARDR